jgi:DHA1 family multidrug resistance protein-like MFS transporter
MLDIVREAPLGQAIRFVSRNRLLQYPEENLEFELPTQYVSLLNNDPEKPQDQASATSNQFNFQNDIAPYQQSPNEATIDLETARTITSIHTTPYTNERLQAEHIHSLARTKSLPIVPQKTTEGIVLVDWYTTDDSANPQNWSSFKKAFVVFILCCYTWTIYCAGPIYSTATEGIMQRFGVSAVAASLGLGLYVLAYGVGDLLFSPLTEIPVVGRNPVYYLTFIIFWILAFPTAVADSFGGLLALRFFLGFFGSPALANG